MDSHPEAPRTLWTQVRDNLPLTAETVALGLELERGRHPTLTDLRAALGLDLELGGSWEAARGVRLPRDETPSRELLADFLDAMYRAMASSRLVRVTASDEDLEAAGVSAPVRLRAGEELALLVLVDNRKQRAVDCSARVQDAEAHGEAEAGRTASMLVNGGAVSRSGSLELSIECDGSALTQPVRVEVAPSWRLSCRILDGASGEPVAARVYLTDELGPAWPQGATVRRDEHENAFFHADGAFDVRVSGQANFVVIRGMEYEPFELEIDAPRSGDRSETARLRRWSQMAAEGWRSGDVHVHLHYGGEYLFSPADASLVQRGEDVHFMNMMVANQGSAFVHDRANFQGGPHELSDADHILRWGEEYRNDFYGHLCMYGIRELVPPIYSGFRLSEHPHDLPANAVAADRCHEVGGTLSYAHPLFAGGDLDRVFAQARTVEAKELPVDVALGKIDALDVMSYPSVDLETAALWYRLLNCGFRLPATAGTDTFMNFAGTGVFSNPPAGNRVFARVAGAFTTEAWCEAVREGRTFVTNGPMLRLSVGGQGIGAELPVEAGKALTVQGEASSYAPMQQIELVANGEVVAQGEVSDDGTTATLEHAMTAETSCWVALRAVGARHPTVLGGPVFAHTSPVYITVGGAPVEDPAAARYFVEWIDRLIAMCDQHGRYPSEAQREEVTTLFRSAQERYRLIASR